MRMSREQALLLALPSLDILDEVLFCLLRWHSGMQRGGVAMPTTCARLQERRHSCHILLRELVNTVNVRRILRGNRGNRREWEESTRKMLEKPPPISFLSPILFPLAWDGEEQKRDVQPEPGHRSSLPLTKQHSKP